VVGHLLGEGGLTGRAEPQRARRLEVLAATGALLGRVGVQPRAVVAPEAVLAVIDVADLVDHLVGDGGTLVEFEVRPRVVFRRVAEDGTAARS